MMIEKYNYISKFGLLLFILIGFSSCKKTKDIEKTPSVFSGQINKFSCHLMVIPIWQGEWFNEYFYKTEDSIGLKYNTEGKLVNTSGVWVPLSYASGFPEGNYFNGKEGGMELTYHGAEVTTSSIIFHPDGKLIIRSSVLNFVKNKLVKIVERNNRNTEIRTTLLIYDAKGSLKQTVTTQNKYVVYTADYIFNTAGNLIAIEGKAVLDNNEQLYSTLEKFDDYDQSPNPFKGFDLLSETFYRSLSVNNFRKYSYEYFSESRLFKTQLSWSFLYDKSGNWILSK